MGNSSTKAEPFLYVCSPGKKNFVYINFPSDLRDNDDWDRDLSEEEEKEEEKEEEEEEEEEEEDPEVNEILEMPPSMKITELPALDASVEDNQFIRALEISKIEQRPEGQGSRLISDILEKGDKQGPLTDYGTGGNSLCYALVMCALFYELRDTCETVEQLEEILRWCDFTPGSLYDFHEVFEKLWNCKIVTEGCVITVWDGNTMTYFSQTFGDGQKKVDVCFKSLHYMAGKPSGFEYYRPPYSMITS